MTTLAAQYYDALIGSWSGHYQLVVTQPAALSKLPFRGRLMGTMVRLDGNLTMSTTLQRVSEGIYEHTTRMSRWGLTIATSREFITVAPDGKQFVISGVQKMPFGREPFEGIGTIDDDANGADYPLSWLGQPLRQRTRVQPDGVRIVHETSWSRATVLLQRTS
ncbi:MAG: hypothetical protein KGO50_08265 [Myxococcales bacterium]|nr:hypothetical protein [Myxococcales bacterium]